MDNLADSLFNSLEADYESANCLDSFDHDLDLNIRQLSSLISHLDAFDFRLDEQLLDKKEKKFQLDQYQFSLKIVLDLYGFYRSRKFRGSDRTAESNFYKYLIIKHINTLNDKFNLNKRLTLNGSNLYHRRRRTSEEEEEDEIKLNSTKLNCLDIYDDYELFDSIVIYKRAQLQEELKIRNHLNPVSLAAANRSSESFFKLRVSSLYLFDDSGQYECAVLQFGAAGCDNVSMISDRESNAGDFAKHNTTTTTNNTAKSQKHRALSRFTSKESKEKSSRRSTSADYKSKYCSDNESNDFNLSDAKNRGRARLIKKDLASLKSNHEDLSLSHDDLSFWSNRSCQSCIKSDRFRFHLNDSTVVCKDSRDQIIDILPKCTNILIVVYKCFKSSDGALKYPYKYVMLDLNELLAKNRQQTPCRLDPAQQLTTLFDSYKLNLIDYENSLFNTNLIIQNLSSNQTNDDEKTNSVFKRMFNIKQRSSHGRATSKLNEQSHQLKNKSATLNSGYRNLNQSSDQLQTNLPSITIDLSNSRSELLLYKQKFIDLVKFEAWSSLWQPKINFDNKLNEFDFLTKPSSKDFVYTNLITFYLNKFELNFEEELHLSAQRLNESSKKFKLKIQHQNSSLNEEETFYYVKVRLDHSRPNENNLIEFVSSKSQLHSCCLFQSNQNVNDLFRVGTFLGYWDHNLKIQIKFELYKVKIRADDIEAIDLIGFSSLEVINESIANEFKKIVFLNREQNQIIGFLKLKYDNQVNWRFSSDSFTYFNEFDFKPIFQTPNDQLSLIKERDLINLIDSFNADLNNMKPKSLNEREENYQVNDELILRKFLEFFAVSNINQSLIRLSHFSSDSSIDKISSARRMARKQLMLKLFDLFIKLLNKFNQINNHDLNQNVKSLISNLNLNHKSITQSIVSILKSLIEEDNLSKNAASTNQDELELNQQHELRFETTMKCFHNLIEILVGLTTSASRLELKYELNDLLAKLFGMKRLQTIESRLNLFSKLNFKFLSSLDNLFTGFEIVELISSKLMMISDESKLNSTELGEYDFFVLRLLNENLFESNLFIENYQFRDKLVDLILRKYLDYDPKQQLQQQQQQRQLTKSNRTFIVFESQEQINLIMNLLKCHTRLSKLNLDNFIKSSIRIIINSLTIHLNLNGERHHHHHLTSKSSMNQGFKSEFHNSDFVISEFFSLIDLLGLIVTSRSNSANQNYSYYMDLLNHQDLIALFSIITFYLKFDAKTNSSNPIYAFKKFHLNKHKLWLSLNLTIVKFLKYIQKHLIRYIITKLSSSSTSPMLSSLSSSTGAAETLIESYFDVHFCYLDQFNCSLNLNLKMKFDVLNNMLSFWKCLNIQLKRSPKLYEYLLNRMISALFVNFYFSNLVINLNYSTSTTNTYNNLNNLTMGNYKHIETKLSPYLIIDAANNNNNNNNADINKTSLFGFFELYFNFLNELFIINLNYLFNVEQFHEYVFVSLTKCVVKHLKRRNRKSELASRGDRDNDDDDDGDDEDESISLRIPDDMDDTLIDADQEIRYSDLFSKQESSSSTNGASSNQKSTNRAKSSSSSNRSSVDLFAPVDHSTSILKLIETILIDSSRLNQLENNYFINIANRRQLFNTIKTCFSFNHLKEDQEFEANVSIIEKHILVYDLVKSIAKINLNNRIFTKPDHLSQLKRKLEMCMLEELYKLHRRERNYLQMSFIRKVQADLLEWNLEKRKESELKEILYLKSLKKLAFNSMNEKCSISSGANQFLQKPPLPQSPLKNKTSISLPVSNEINNGGFLSSIQFEIFKQLGAYYEKLDENYSKFTRILNMENKLAQMVVENQTVLNNTNYSNNNNNGTLHGHLYFRIGFFGRSLRFDSIRNKYFIYKHSTYEMLSNIQSLMLNKLSYAEWTDEKKIDDEQEESPQQLIHKVFLLHYNHEPDYTLKESPTSCYIQICALNKMDRNRLLELIDEMSEDKETMEMRAKLSKYEKSAQFYYFDRPFYDKRHSSISTNSHSSTSSTSSSSLSDSANLATTKHFTGSSALEDDTVAAVAHDDYERAAKAESVENLWLERNVLILDDKCVEYENITQFEEIRSTFKIMLNPIRNAINDINEKTRELKQFIIQFTTTNANLNFSYSHTNVIHNLQPLTMRLLGCLDARVNGGLIKYVREMLSESQQLDFKIGKKQRQIVAQLYNSIREQLNVLESGLSVHDKILKDVEVRFKDQNGKNAAHNCSNSKLNDATVAESNDSADYRFHHKSIDNLKHMNQLNEHLIECLKTIEQELNERWEKLS